MPTLTVTERWNGAHGVTWTARDGRATVARVYSPMVGGMVDSGALLSAVADVTGTVPSALRLTRTGPPSARRLVVARA